MKVLAVVLALCPVLSAAEAALFGADAASVAATNVLAQAQVVPAPLPMPVESAALGAQTFSPEEEASLAARNEQPGPEVAGGAWNNQTLTYVVIALAAAVFVLILK